MSDQTPTTKPTMIEFRDVHKYYGDYHALRGINGTIRAGEFFSLLGPSGCGKTTLLRTIAGFEGIDKGAVLIDAKDMAKVPANERPTNMVFQSYAIFPHMSVGDNVGFGLRRDPRSKTEKARAVEEALEMVGLKGYGGRAAHALSGGQRQRVALARALILKPKVLLLDEPLSALDKKMREHMQVELIKLQRQVGITFVLVTHDQEEALVMSDRIAVMFEGSIAQLADPETLYRRPISKQVAEFIGTMNFIPAQVVSETADRIEVEAKGLGRATLTAEQCPKGQGDAPMVGLRPETLTLMYPGQTTTERTVDGIIDEVIYFGDMTYYDVYLGGTDVEVRLSMRNTPGRPILDVGSKVDVAWSPEALVLFR